MPARSATVPIGSSRAALAICRLVFMLLLCYTLILVDRIRNHPRRLPAQGAIISDFCTIRIFRAVWVCGGEGYQRVSIYMIDGSRLRGGRQGWPATPAPPARGVCPLEPQNDAITSRAPGAHASGMSGQSLQDSFVSANQRHVLTRSFLRCHQLQGVWGAARPPSGEREGRSRLAHTFMVRACIIAV